MMTLHTEQATPNVEREALFPTSAETDPYAGIKADGAYIMVQRQIADFVALQNEALQSGDKVKIGNAMALEHHIVTQTIPYQIMQGFLGESTVPPEDIKQASQEYFKESLARYREAGGPDPRIIEQKYEEHADFIPTPGVNISFEEAAALSAGRLIDTQPAHITEVSIESLPADRRAEVRKDEKRFLRIIKGLGRAVVSPAASFIHSGEISTQQTK